MEYPAALFASLKKNLRLKKSAFLLPESETGVFVPWSATGFDKTTQRRMRIPPGLLYEVMRVLESKTILTSLAELEELEPCFSSREAALAEAVFLCFFTIEDKIMAVLLVTDSPYLLLEERILRLFFTVVTQIASPPLAQARAVRLQEGRGYVRKDRFLAALKSYAREFSKDESLTFFTLDAKTLVAAIRESHDDVDDYRVLEDITAVIGKLFPDSPVFVSARRKKILTVTRTAQFDSALLHHQVSLMMKRLFQGSTESPGIAIAENALPAGNIPGDAVGEFL